MQKGLALRNRLGACADVENLCSGLFESLLREPRLPDVRFRDLRHTCATLLLSWGVYPKIVSEMLGHANIGIMLDTYSRVIPGMGEAAAGAVNDSLEQSPGGSRTLGWLPAKSPWLEAIESRRRQRRCADGLRKGRR